MVLMDYNVTSSIVYYITDIIRSTPHTHIGNKTIIKKSSYILFWKIITTKLTMSVED